MKNIDFRPSRFISETIQDTTIDRDNRRPITKSPKWYNIELYLQWQTDRKPCMIYRPWMQWRRQVGTRRSTCPSCKTYAPAVPRQVSCNELPYKKSFILQILKLCVLCQINSKNSPMAVRDFQQNIRTETTLFLNEIIVLQLSSGTKMFLGPQLLEWLLMQILKALYWPLFEIW